jgi:hypothetical protein
VLAQARLGGLALTFVRIGRMVLHLGHAIQTDLSVRMILAALRGKALAALAFAGILGRCLCRATLQRAISNRNSEFSRILVRRNI